MGSAAVLHSPHTRTDVFPIRGAGHVHSVQPRTSPQIDVRLDIVEWQVQGAGVEVDKHQPFPRGDQFDLKQPVVLGDEAGRFIKFWGLDKATLVVVLPAVVLAREAGGRAARLAHHGVGAVSADVVEGSELHVLAQHDEEGNLGDLRGVVVAGLVEPAAVADVQPRLLGSIWISGLFEAGKQQDNWLG